MLYQRNIILQGTIRGKAKTKIEKFLIAKREYG